jgi:hypothetical protein
LYVQDSPETTPTQQSTLQPAPTASTAPQSTSSASSNQSSSHAGQIAGGVVGGIIGAALLAALAFWYLRRRRWRAEAQPSPYTDKVEAFGLPDSTSGTTMSIGRFYVRAITRWHFFLLSTRLLCGCLTYHARTHLTRAPTQNRSRLPQAPRYKPPQVLLNTVTASSLVRTTGAGTPVCRLFDPMMNLRPSPFLVFFLADPVRVV